MRNGRVIIDAVGHTYDFRDDNRREDVPYEGYKAFAAWLHGYGHTPVESKDGNYMLSLDEFNNGWTTEELVSLFFEESDIDVVAMHAVNFFNLFKRGANPWEQCLAVKRAAPERVLLYAAVDPLSDRSEELEKMAMHAEEGINGFKFYPVNGLTDYRNAPLSYSFADERIFPFFDRARQLGINHIAIHKALPTGPGPNAHDRPEDVAHAAAAFPDMTFEVVHSGWAFVEDCAVQMSLNANIYANLESTANTVIRMPRRFARAVGALLVEAPDRVLFGTGAPLSHPQPIIEAIEAFQMPQDLVDEGLPEFTEEIKTKLLGGNMARLHGLDVEAIAKNTEQDAFAQRRAAYLEDPQPWRLKRERLGARVEKAS